jgi:hypothetical protein
MRLVALLAAIVVAGGESEGQWSLPLSSFHGNIQEESGSLLFPSDLASFDSLSLLDRRRDLWIDVRFAAYSLVAASMCRSYRCVQNRGSAMPG